VNPVRRKILLVGVSCVGKTTIGRLLAGRLGLPFFDLGEEIERYFETSIERLQSRLLTGYSYRKETAVVLKHILAENDNCVIALAPSGLRDAYLRVIKTVDCVTVAIDDKPENILQRITFYDIDSRLIEKRLTPKEKNFYLEDIRKDINFFKRSYRRADLHADINGLDAQAGAEKIAGLLAPFVER